MDAVPETWYTGSTGLPESRESGHGKKKHEWLVLDGVILQEHVGHILAREELSIKIVIGTTAHSGTPSQYLSPNVTLNSTQVEIIVRDSLLGTSGLAEDALQ